LWEAANGKLRAALPALDALGSAVAFSPDGRWLVSSDAKAVRLWDLNTLKEVKTLPGHLGTVHRLLFSADGNVLVTGGGDGTALVWDVAALTRDQKQKAVKLAPGELDTLWGALSGEDAEKAYAAVRSLAGA